MDDVQQQGSVVDDGQQGVRMDGPDTDGQQVEHVDGGRQLAPAVSGASSSEKRRDSIIATAVWILCSLTIIILLTGIWLRLRDEQSIVQIDSLILKGERPVAPALPTTLMSGIDVDPLPEWYKPEVFTTGDPAREILVVNAWASWCGPCKEEAPALQKIADEYDGRVTVVGINLEDGEGRARRFAKRYNLTFPLLRGSNSDKRRWDIGGYPETYIVGVDGRVSSFFNGEIDEPTLRAALDAELGEDRV